MKRKALLGPGNLSTVANMRDNANMLGNNPASGAIGEPRNSNNAIGLAVGNVAVPAPSLAHGGGDSAMAMTSVVNEMVANKACACFAEPPPNLQPDTYLI